MAIVKMKKITIVALKKDRERILSTLQAKGVMEISSGTDELLSHEKMSQTDVDAKIRSCEKALEILSSFAEKANKSRGESVYSDELCNEVTSLFSKKQKKLEKIKKLDYQALGLKPYEKLDIKLDQRKIGDVSLKIGVIPGDISDNELSKVSEYSYFETISSAPGKTYVFVATSEDISEQLIKLGFVEEKYKSERCPGDEIKYLKAQKKAALQEISEIDQKLKAYSLRINELSLTPLLREKEMLAARTMIGNTESTTVIEGYIDAKYEKAIKRFLKYAYVLIEDAPAGTAPVAFNNGMFASPVEEVTGTYSMPSENDIDPNPIMAFFYYLFFGMMFSDAGYGLLLVLVCGYLGFIKKQKSSKMFQMFFFCGISTTFWGFMYGSFFGNAIQTVSDKFFNSPMLLQPLWIDPTGEPLKLLILSIALGFLQIVVGLLIKFYMMIRQKKVMDAICDTGSWILVLMGICIYIVGMIIPSLKNVGAVVAVLGVAILILTAGRNNKNIVGKAFGGIISLYDITSYVSDILSYSRLMALGLTTGVIANVVNTLGSLGGKSFVGVVMYIIVFIAGHGINFAINMLGAYVHTNRLQYVEFFSKFYEGGGKRFKPFGALNK